MPAKAGIFIGQRKMHRFMVAMEHTIERSTALRIFT
jgi:hypothetical protein